ncbi:hypothetical protein [Tengunoibacter tsumagoiensis]|uniref:Uncharacterized protein n=1 Tax=Tengunoibacter tsumagoiensis TaxID=2014871 RepID=A0A401ZTF3_9CHLR|nr:hypothetical protein [Tengunoibacter tsumagoiensis]GCE10169.1 hypothetical protein KTT_00280 [Tengunoibacter tsumagoiensis]
MHKQKYLVELGRMSFVKGKWEAKTRSGEVGEMAASSFEREATSKNATQLGG